MLCLNKYRDSTFFGMVSYVKINNTMYRVVFDHFNTLIAQVNGQKVKATNTGIQNSRGKIKKDKKKKKKKKSLIPTVPRLRIWSPTILLTRLERA